MTAADRLADDVGRLFDAALGPVDNVTTRCESCGCYETCPDVCERCEWRER